MLRIAGNLLERLATFKVDMVIPLTVTGTRAVENRRELPARKVILREMFPSPVRGAKANIRTVKDDQLRRENQLVGARRVPSPDLTIRWGRS